MDVKNLPLTARGIKKDGSITKTLSCHGKFENETYRQEFFAALRGR